MRRSLVVVGVLALVVLGAGPAVAAPPLDLDGRITDQVDALGPDQAAAEDAITALTDNSDIDLHVAFIDGFEEEAENEWVQETARMSGLSESDTLLAVAVGEDTYEYQWWVDEDFPLSQVAVEDVIADEVQPRLESNDWGAAVVTYADELQSLADAEVVAEEEDVPEWSTTTTALVVGGVVLVLLVAHLLSRRRSPARSDS